MCMSHHYRGRAAAAQGRLSSLLQLMSLHFQFCVDKVQRWYFIDNTDNLIVVLLALAECAHTFSVSGVASCTYACIY